MVRHFAEGVGVRSTSISHKVRNSYMYLPELPDLAIDIDEQLPSRYPSRYPCTAQHGSWARRRNRTPVCPHGPDRHQVVGKTKRKYGGAMPWRRILQMIGSYLRRAGSGNQSKYGGCTCPTLTTPRESAFSDPGFVGVNRTERRCTKYHY